MRQRLKGRFQVAEEEKCDCSDASSDTPFILSARRSKKRFRLRLLQTRTKKAGWLSFLVVAMSFLLRRRIQLLWKVDNKVVVMSPMNVAFHQEDFPAWSRPRASNFVRLPPTITIPRRPDYGGLSIRSLWKLLPQSNRSYQRQIRKDDQRRYNEERRKFLREIDEDLETTYYRSEELDYPQNCIRPNWVWDYYPACNKFHEISIDESLANSRRPRHNHRSRTSAAVGIRYLNHGASREAWLVEPAVRSNDDFFPFVLKTMILDYDFDAWSLRRIHVEALILERLSASDRTTDIYGYCSSSLMVELGSEITELIVPDQGRPQISKRALAKLQKDKVHPMNNYTAEEKLELALGMAEGIAELHGYQGGVIVNSDIHPEQWVRSKIDGKIKLNDFNNGLFLDWSPRKQRYCRAYESFGGDFHSPEEFRGDYVNEQIDVYSMGNNIHCLLTGLWQFPWVPEDGEVQDLVISGERDHVDPRYQTRSLIEGRLVEIMEQAWIHDPDERASIFEVVQHLRETRRLHKQNTGGTMKGK